MYESQYRESLNTCMILLWTKNMDINKYELTEKR